MSDIEKVLNDFEHVVVNELEIISNHALDLINLIRNNLECVDVCICIADALMKNLIEIAKTNIQIDIILTLNKELLFSLYKRKLNKEIYYGRDY